MASASMSMSLVSPPRGPRPRSRLLSPSSVAPPLSAFSRRACTSVIFSPARPPALPRIVCCSSAAVAVPVSNGRPEVRLGLPSKGRMADDTLGFLKDCQMPVKLVNPRQCVTEIPQLSNLQALFERPEDTVDKLFSGDLDVGIVDSDTVSEHGLVFDTVSEHGRIILELSNLRVWFEQPEDIVEKLLSGDLDIGIVGFDTVSEHGQGNEDLIIVHEALDYGNCRLSLAIPKYGIFEKINSVKELAQMPQWTEEKPLRVATGFGYLGPKFMKENGLKHVSFSNGEGALEGAPAMGTADVILDLVSSGTALRENNLKEIEGGTVLESQAVLVASRKSLIQREGVLGATREILDRMEAHLKAVGQFMVTANMRGSSAEEVAKRLLSQPSLSGGGLQGLTVAPVIRKGNGEYGIVICVPEEALNSTVQQLRAIGVSRVLVSRLTYSFDEESPRWQPLLSKLGL